MLIFICGKKLIDVFSLRTGIMLVVFTQSGTSPKAIGIRKEMDSNNCKPNAITYRHLTLGYLKAGQVTDAIKTLKDSKWTPLTKRNMQSTLNCFKFGEAACDSARWSAGAGERPVREQAKRETPVRRERGESWQREIGRASCRERVLAIV